jgi:hypothetical protein
MKRLVPQLDLQSTRIFCIVIASDPEIVAGRLLAMLDAD